MRSPTYISFWSFSVSNKAASNQLREKTFPTCCPFQLYFVIAMKVAVVLFFERAPWSCWAIENTQKLGTQAQALILIRRVCGRRVGCTKNRDCVGLEQETLTPLNNLRVLSFQIGVTRSSNKFLPLRCFGAFLVSQPVIIAVTKSGDNSFPLFIVLRVSPELDCLLTTLFVPTENKNAVKTKTKSNSRRRIIEISMINTGIRFSSSYIWQSSVY